MIQRIKNLWAWSAINPNEPFKVEDQGFRWSGWVKPQQQVEAPDMAQIIYPNPKDEVLKNNPNPSIDDLYEAR